MKAVSGELDFQVRHVLFKDFTLFMENRSQGDYRVLQWDTTVGADPYFFPNLTVKDPVLRKLFETPEFRFALSLGIKRDEINQLIWSGQATPRPGITDAELQVLLGAVGQLLHRLRPGPRQRTAR